MSDTESATDTASVATENEGSTDGLPENPTGAQAKAYFESQKAKAKIDPKFSSEGREKLQKDESQKARGEPTEQADTPDKEAAPVPRKFKVKVEGSEIEVDEAELLRGYSHQKAANKILQEGKQARRKAEEFLSMMKDEQRVFDVIKQLGHDPRKLTEKYLVSQLEDELLDPKDRELKQYKQRVADIEAKEQAERDRLEEQQNEERKGKYVKEYNDAFVKALTESNLPPSKSTIAEMAKYISRSAKIGFQMTAQEAAVLVKQDLMEYKKRLINDIDGEELVKFLGEDVANKIRKYDTSKIKSPESFLKTPNEQAERVAVKSTNKRMSPAEWARIKRGL